MSTGLTCRDCLLDGAPLLGYVPVDEVSHRTTPLASHVWIVALTRIGWGG